MAKKPQTFNFKFVKNSDFKTVGVNGAVGGVTINGQVNMNFYIDAVDIPRDVEHTVENNKISLQPIKASNLQYSAIREIPFGVNFDMNTAKNLLKWLQNQIATFEDGQKKLIEGKEAANGSNRS